MYVYNTCIYIFQILTMFRNTAPIVMAAVATRTMYASWFRALGLEGFVGLGSGQGDGLPPLLELPCASLSIILPLLAGQPSVARSLNVGAGSDAK